MNIDWISLLIGLILGWLLEWIIDWIYWRKGRVDPDEFLALQENLETAELRVTELETSLDSKQVQLDNLQAKIDDLQAVQGELDQCQTHYADLEADYAQLLSDYSALKNAADEERIRAIGRLTTHEGIDETNAGLLYDAGIASSDDLLNADDAAIQAALGLDDDDYAAWAGPVKASLAGLGAALVASRVLDEEVVEEEGEDEGDFEGDLIIEEVLETFDFDDDGEVDLVVETVTEGLDIDEDGQVDIILDQRIEADILDEDTVAAAEEALDAEIDAELEAMEEEPDLEGARLAAAIDIAAEADDLTQIQGIGPRFSEKLYDSGIRTFAALAVATDDDLNDAIKPHNWQRVDYPSWRAQAQTLAEVPLPKISGDNLQLIEGIGPKYSELLREADILTFAELADSDPERLAEIIGAPGWRNVDYDSWIAQAGLAAAGNMDALTELQDALNKPQENKLTLIHGLGDSWSAVLADAGILTFDDLGNQTPEQLAAIAAASGLRSADFEAWIEEARLRAAGKRVPRQTRTREYENAVFVSCPQDLESIEGIGTVYENRLYKAGVGSYWEVSQLSDTQLTDTLGIMPFQDVDLAAIRASAMALAAESGTVNQVWDGTEPDDFEPLTGLGVIYERRLYQAGYCTYEALAAATPEALEAACRPPAGRKPDFADWIATAQILAAAKGVVEE
ncbi:MAG: helix-hairpin-helix domain-containing protein [Candidatus Promineifilaceae bacterium]|jgi:predicted flap endonuclease-1-like 5' DNA nuclease